MNSQMLGHNPRANSHRSERRFGAHQTGPAYQQDPRKGLPVIPCRSSISVPGQNLSSITSLSRNAILIYINNPWICRLTSSDIPNFDLNADASLQKKAPGAPRPVTLDLLLLKCIQEVMQWKSLSSPTVDVYIREVVGLSTEGGPFQSLKRNISFQIGSLTEVPNFPLSSPDPVYGRLQTIKNENFAFASVQSSEFIYFTHIVLFILFIWVTLSWAMTGKGKIRRFIIRTCYSFRLAYFQVLIKEIDSSFILRENRNTENYLLRTPCP